MSIATRVIKRAKYCNDCKYKVWDYRRSIARCRCEKYDLVLFAYVYVGDEVRWGKLEVCAEEGGYESKNEYSL